jgi:DNA polymerase III epsilon subunit-like protein
MKPTWRGPRWFIDIEGNGAQVSEIVELGAVETINLVPTGRTLRWLVKPAQPINFFATKVHRIRNKHVAKAPSIADVTPQIMAALNGVPVGGHAVSGDLDLMARDVPDWQASSALDSLEVARTLMTNCAGFRLQNLVQHFGLDDDVRSHVGGRPHSALYDAAASALVLRAIRDEFGMQRFEAACAQADGLAQWRLMLAKRKAKAEKAARDEAKRRRRQKQKERSGNAGE